MALDPYQPIRPYKRQETKPDPLREFGAEYRTSIPRPTRTRPPAALDLCRFINGREVERGYNCPHYREPEDG